MRISLQIPDDLYENYASRADGKVSVEELCAAQLERFKQVSPMDRVVVVLPRERAALEAKLSGGTLRDGVDLLSKVERLADLEIGEIKIDFTPGELQNIKTYASKNRIPFPEAMKRIVYGMKEEFGLYVG